MSPSFSIWQPVRSSDCSRDSRAINACKLGLDTSQRPDRRSRRTGAATVASSASEASSTRTFVTRNPRNGGRNGGSPTAEDALTWDAPDASLAGVYRQSQCALPTKEPSALGHPRPEWSASRRGRGGRSGVRYRESGSRGSPKAGRASAKATPSDAGGLAAGAVTRLSAPGIGVDDAAPAGGRMASTPAGTDTAPPLGARATVASLPTESSPPGASTSLRRTLDPGSEAARRIAADGGDRRRSRREPGDQSMSSTGGINTARRIWSSFVGRAQISRTLLARGNTMPSVPMARLETGRRWYTCDADRAAARQDRQAARAASNSESDRNENTRRRTSGGS